MKGDMTVKLNISDLCDDLEQDAFNEIQPIDQDEISTSSERIKRIALDKIESKNIKIESKKKRIFAKHKTLKALLIAATILCLSCVTVFALNNSVLFERFFGEDISKVQGNIVNSTETAADSNIKMSIESVLSDGYVSYFVVSLEKLDGSKFNIDERPDFRIVNKIRGSHGTGVKEIKSEGDVDSKKYYMIKVSSDTKIMEYGAAIELRGIYKNEENNEYSLKSNLSVKVNYTGRDNYKHAVIDDQKEDSKNYCFTEVSISPMGLVVKGTEKKETDKPIFYKIQLNLQNGNTEKISWKSESGELLSGMITRSDNKFSYLFIFNKLKNIEEIKSITLNNKEYLFK